MASLVGETKIDQDIQDIVFGYIKQHSTSVAVSRKICFICASYYNYRIGNSLFTPLCIQWEKQLTNIGDYLTTLSVNKQQKLWQQFDKQNRGKIFTDMVFAQLIWALTAVFAKVLDKPVPSFSALSPLCYSIVIEMKQLMNSDVLSRTEYDENFPRYWRLIAKNRAPYVRPIISLYDTHVLRDRYNPVSSHFVPYFNEMDQDVKHVVFGYLNLCQRLLPTDVDYYQIPQHVYFVCLSYFTGLYTEECIEYKRQLTDIANIVAKWPKHRLTKVWSHYNPEKWRQLHSATIASIMYCLINVCVRYRDRNKKPTLKGAFPLCMSMSFQMKRILNTNGTEYIQQQQFEENIVKVLKQIASKANDL